MSAIAKPTASSFAADLAEGLSAADKYISPAHLFDDVGVSLFETIRMLPEHGIGRAEERVLRRRAPEMDALFRSLPPTVDLAGAGKNLGSVSNWLQEAGCAASQRQKGVPLLLTLPHGLIGQLNRAPRQVFLEQLRQLMKPGDYFLLSADLIKDIDKMLCAYDDDAGIVAAFNRNVLARVNRELGGHFNLRQFEHQVRWDAFLRRVEMHLASSREQQVYISSLGRRFSFRAGETIHTNSAHKFSELELEELAQGSGFKPVKSWIDIEWAFAEALLTV
jgi:uncharacterized SAM-dependent methyltransferase